MPHRGFIHINQAGADKRPRIHAGIGRTHHAAMQHAGHTNVVYINQLASGLCGQVDARHRLPDDAVSADILHRDVIGKFEADVFARQKFAIADAAVILAAHQPVFNRKLGDRQFQPLRRACDQKLPRLCGRVAQGDRRDLDRFARNRRALVRHF